jgi:arabinogalactan oligomer/maltooligosaccharide transport system permease protein
MDKGKIKHVLKGLASAFLPGLGQIFNKQFIKALFFFIFFAAFFTIEFSSGKYFQQYDPYSVFLTVDADGAVHGELFSDELATKFYQMYVYQKSKSMIDLPDFETYYATVSDGGFTMRELIAYAAQNISEASTPRYFRLDTDVIVSGITASTSNTGELKGTDLIIGTDDAAITAKAFRPIYTYLTVYELNDVEYFKLIEGEGDTRTVTYVNVNEPSDVILDVTGYTVSTRTTSLYYEPATGKVYVKSENTASVLVNGDDYRYTNVADSSDYVDAADPANATWIGDLKRLTTKGSIVFDETGTLFVRYIPEINYEPASGYNATPFSVYLRNYITKRYAGSTNNYDASNYNRLILEVYLEINPELRASFEAAFSNYFYNRAGFFLKGIWSIITLGTTDDTSYYIKSLHDALGSRTFTEEGIQYQAVTGVLDSYPLKGHVSNYLLINGLISTLLMAYFIFVWIWAVSDAYRTSLEFQKTQKHITDKEWFVAMYEHGFEYIMILPALFVITFISIMPIVFGFLIAFTSYSGFDSDTGLFAWVGLYNFTRIFTFGEGIPFAETFWKVFTWTCIWAIFSTATVFFGGMVQAMIINSERVPFKKIWRTLLILPWAVPALISQMAFSIIFSDKGVINSMITSIGLQDLLTNWGLLGPFNATSGLTRLFYLGQENIQWFTNADNIWFVRITLIVVNIWLGAPYYMALMTSIMTSIDKTLYEAADIDGATKGQKLKFITFPLIMYSTAPLLVMSFSGNFNNFGVIYFITQGGTGAGDIDTAFAGSTDILISWMYTLTVSKKVYNMASVFSILIFLIVGSIAAWNYSQTKAFKED